MPVEGLDFTEKGKKCLLKLQKYSLNKVFTDLTFLVWNEEKNNHISCKKKKKNTPSRFQSMNIN